VDSESNDVVFMVDDSAFNLTVLKKCLSRNYEVHTAMSGEELFELLGITTPSLILLDIEMPGMDGFSVLERLKKIDSEDEIPVILQSSRSDPESEMKGLTLGAVDYITKPFSPKLLLKRVQLHIQIVKQRNELKHHKTSLECEMEKKTNEVMEMQNAILRTVADIVESRDAVTGGHIERTQHYLSLLLDFMTEHGVYSEDVKYWDKDLLITSSLLHDVGKISISDCILNKPSELTALEFEEMKKHTIYGEDIIKRIEETTTESDFLDYAAILAISHHERWDGEGYPHRIKGDNIPIMGRMMAIVDVYDALTNDRTYKKAYSHKQAIDIIAREKGKRFDPEIADLFIMHEKTFELALRSEKRSGMRADVAKLESTA